MLSKQFLSVYLHPDARFKVFKLSDAQFNHILAFALHGESAEGSSFSSPFPLKAERDTIRLFPEFSMLKHHIYRSRNDRKVREINTARWNMGGRLEDDPYLMDFIKSQTGNSLFLVFMAIYLPSMDLMCFIHRLEVIMECICWLMP